MPGWVNRFDSFLAHFTAALQNPLPGAVAQFTLMPPNRPIPDLDAIAKTQNPKFAAVLALFYPIDNKPHLVLMKRNTYEGVHSAQISFPGGKVELRDKSLEETALRETQEEIGVAPNQVEIMGALSRVYIPPSHFMVQPFVGVTHQKPVFLPNPAEVEALVQVPFSAFLTADGVKSVEVTARGATYKVPAFDVQGHIVWGATAMMLAEMRAIVLQHEL